jgi:hypothetical protein
MYVMMCEVDRTGKDDTVAPLRQNAESRSVLWNCSVQQHVCQWTGLPQCTSSAMTVLANKTVLSVGYCSSIVLDMKSGGPG